MVWQGKRRPELPPDWAQRREQRLRIDGGLCTHDGCNAPATDVDHHVAPDKHDVADLRSLCDLHHKQKTQREAQQARGVGISRLRPVQRHPGLR